MGAPTFDTGVRTVRPVRPRRTLWMSGLRNVAVRRGSSTAPAFCGSGSYPRPRSFDSTAVSGKPVALRSRIRSAPTTDGRPNVRYGRSDGTPGAPKAHPMNVRFAPKLGSRQRSLLAGIGPSRLRCSELASRTDAPRVTRAAGIAVQLGPEQLTTTHRRRCPPSTVIRTSNAASAAQAERILRCISGTGH